MVEFFQTSPRFATDHWVLGDGHDLGGWERNLARTSTGGGSPVLAGR